MGKTKKEDKPRRKRNETESQRELRLLGKSKKVERDEMEESFLLRMSAHYNRGIMRWPQTGKYQLLVKEIIASDKDIATEADFWYEISGGSRKKIRKDHVVKTLGDIIRQAILMKHRTINEYLKNTNAIRRDFLFRVLRRQSLPTALKLHDIATDLGYPTFYALVKDAYKTPFIPYVQEGE